MAHTMVAGPSATYIFGGFSLAYGPLNDVWKVDVNKGFWEKMNINQVPSSVPFGRYYHSAVFYQVVSVIFLDEYTL